MNKLIAAPLLALALLGATAPLATADPFPGAPSGSAVPFGAPFQGDAFHEDFFARAQAHQESEEAAWTAYPSLRNAPGHCPPGEMGAPADASGLVAQNADVETSLFGG
ncbi:hypothetical protein [Streptomyces sp. NBC_01304]|uniref:hypothetical protein n=1 Tax=Streptomyces sp. NBC_01304 TaxID=2903818 RepID=UPI002E10E778|nr:hypothetical protein OG430_28320 [Streptomyces sp. NBC_01304]